MAWELETGKNMRDCAKGKSKDLSPLLLIGPEGGFTADEQSAAIAAGATAVRLGPHILRIETAAIAISAAWRLRG